MITAVAGPTADANGPYEGDAICGSLLPNITLDGSGSIAGGTAITDWDWYEGSTYLGNGEYLDHYFAPGSYTVTLEVTDENGCTDSDTAGVVITAVCNDLNYLLIQGFNGNSGACTGLQETHEEFPPVPQLIDPGISWLYMKNQATPNIKWINFIARYDNSSTTIEYKYQYRLHYERTGVTTGWLPGHDWTSPAVGSLVDDGTHGYGFLSGCMDAPSSPSEKYYCCEFEIQIRVNGDNSNIYTVHID